MREPSTAGGAIGARRTSSPSIQKTLLTRCTARSVGTVMPGIQWIFEESLASKNHSSSNSPNYTGTYRSCLSSTLPVRIPIMQISQRTARTAISSLQVIRVRIATTGRMSGNQRIASMVRTSSTVNLVMNSPNVNHAMRVLFRRNWSLVQIVLSALISWAVTSVLGVSVSGMLGTVGSMSSSVRSHTKRGAKRWKSLLPMFISGTRV